MDVLVSGRWLFTRGFSGVKTFGVELKSHLLLILQEQDHFSGKSRR